MSQIVQGNNLRLLFADMPPSTKNGNCQVKFNPYRQEQFEYNPYAPSPRNVCAGRPSTGSTCNAPEYGGVPPHQIPRPNPYHRVNTPLWGEILMASDDHVMKVQLLQ